MTRMWYKKSDSECKPKWVDWTLDECVGNGERKAHAACNNRGLANSKCKTSVIG